MSEVTSFQIYHLVKEITIIKKCLFKTGEREELKLLMQPGTLKQFSNEKFRIKE